jgi:hypothetical protein
MAILCSRETWGGLCSDLHYSHASSRFVEATHATPSGGPGSHVAIVSPSGGELGGEWGRGSPLCKGVTVLYCTSVYLGYTTAIIADLEGI